jgi:hypothetical protein
VTCLAINALKIAVICARYKIWDNSMVQDAVEEETVMPRLLNSGTTSMTPRAMCNQRMQQLSTHAGCIMVVHILGPNAGKIQIQIIFKVKRQQDEVVIATKVNDTRETTTTTVETITTTLKPVSISTTKSKPTT